MELLGVLSVIWVENFQLEPALALWRNDDEPNEKNVGTTLNF
jgi:hypothetical protein